MDRLQKALINRIERQISIRMSYPKKMLIKPLRTTLKDIWIGRQSINSSSDYNKATGK